MRRLTVAATQMSCGWDRQANLDQAERLVRDAAKQGAKVILLQELFDTPYFCADEKSSYFALATRATENAAVQRFSGIARELGVVLPISFFERGENSYFNSLAMIDANGRLLTVYRKSHIPQAPGYQEKYYFTPGDTGIRAIDTAYGRIGAAICWDQWFPETARLLVLQGAELLLYPTAIGSEPATAGYDSRDHWRRCMQGHAAANMVPVIASNRIGHEKNESCAMQFYGSSFITDQFGGLLAEADRQTRGVITATIELDDIKEQRASWGLFRDRRTDLYGGLLSHHGLA